MLPILNLPIGSAICLLVAGILIGHLIWFRDRSSEEATLHGLRAENDELQSALHEHKQAYVTLESDLDDRLKEWNQLKSANKQLEKAHHASDQDIAELNSEITRLQQLKDQAFHDLDQERQKRRSLQEALTQAEDNSARVGNLTNQLQSEVAAFQDEQKQIDGLASVRLAEKEAEFEQLRTRLEALESERDELAAQVASKTKEAEASSQVAEQYERARLALEVAQRENDSLQKERDEAQAAAEATKLEVGNLKQQQVQEVDSLQSQLLSMTGELETVTTSFAAAKRDLEATDSARVETANQEVASAKAQVESLTAEFDAAKEELEALQQERETLQRQNKSSVEKLASTAQELAELGQSYEGVQAMVRSLEEDLRSLRDERDELVQQVDDERVGREKLEGQVQQVDQLVNQRDQALERAGTLEEEIVGLKAELAQLQEQESSEKEAVHTQLEELRQQNTTLQESLEKLTKDHETVSTMLSDERSRSSKMEADNHRLSAVVAEASERAESVEGDLKARDDKHSEELSHLRSELEETAAQLGRERHQREHLQEVLDARKADGDTLVRDSEKQKVAIAELQQQNTVLQQHSEDLLTLQGEHASVKRMLETAGEQLTSLRSSSVSMVSEQQKLQQQVEELRDENREYSHMVTQLSAEKAGLADQIDQLEESNSSAIQSRSRLDTMLEKLGEENRILQDKLAEFESTKSAIQEQEERLAKVVAQRDEAIGSQANQLDVVKELREQIQSQSRSLSALHQQNEQLQQVATDYDELRREHLQLQSHLRDNADRLQEITTLQHENYSNEETLRDRIAHLEARAKTNEETIRNLRRERAAVMRTRTAPTVPFRTGSVAEEDSGGRMRRDDVLGMVYTQPPKYKDDLKQISGIAQVLEKKLNAFGVYTYRQVMEWDVVAIAEFSKLLSFRDRIERDDWKGQARSLFYEKYGRAA